MASDPHYDDQNKILRNVANIKIQADLDALEKRETLLALMRLQKTPVEGKYDQKHLQAVHQAIFKRVYPWAGELRLITISGHGEMFCRAEYMQSNLDRIFKDLASEKHLKSLKVNEFCDRAAYYLGEINSIHPFREGNGRTQREFMRNLATNAGIYLDWAKTNRQEFYQACSLNHNRGETGPLASILRQAVVGGTVYA